MTTGPEAPAAGPQLPAHVPLVVATRGTAVENVHYGSIAVVDGAGHCLGGVGDRDFPMFTRSTLKPFQALPFILDDGPARFGLSAEQVALLCASHSGEPRHVAAVAEILTRIGCRPAQLQCGCHVPLYYGATNTPAPADLMVTALHHNCSGKHAGFLAWCRQHGQPIETYLEPDHPLQQEIRRRLAELAGLAADRMPMGIDGCSAPNYGLSLARLAHAYARLAVAGREDKALATLFEAMVAHPEMVSGQARGDLLLMQAAPGDWLAKGGADGMQALAIRSRGLGIAIKVADGGLRAVQAAVAAVIEQLGLLPEGMAQTLLPWQQGEIRNYRERVTGRLLPVFRLA